ncbi:MAG: rhodanese-like domain-containing protein [Bacteroidota bacterium]
MKSSIRPIAIITISLFGFLVIISYYADESKFEFTGREMLEIVKDKNYMVSEDSIKSMGQVSLIDIRSQEQYIIKHIDGAVNVPLPDILNETHTDLLKNDTPKIIISDDQTKANETWMLLTQMGYSKVYVLKPKRT